MKNRFRICSLIIAVLMTVGLAGVPMSLAKAEEPYWPTGPELESSAAVLMDVETGAILYGKDVHSTYYPASITKILTALVTLENCDLDETLTFSEDSIYKTYGSHIARQVGEEMTVEETLYGMLLASANECAYALAEHVGGTYDHFLEMMNDKAKELGCTDSYFHNSNGLPDEEHVVSAMDMALISRAAYQNETFRKMIGTKQFVIPPTNMHEEETYVNNHHCMYSTVKSDDYIYDGCVGGKTGYTDEAKSTLVTYVERNGITLVAVTLHGVPTYSHYRDSIKLMDYGFENFEKVPISSTMLSIGQDEIAQEIDFGETEPYIEMDSSGELVLPKNAKLDQLITEINYDNKGDDTIATQDYYYGNNYVGGVPIKARETKVSAFEFDNNLVENKESQVEVIEVGPKFILKIVLIILGVLAIVLVLGYFTRNYYRLRHSRRMKRHRKDRELRYRVKKKKKKDGINLTFRDRHK